MNTTTNPFAALGLPERPDLDDQAVRAAWRQIAAATHPDRPDGGDLARYTQASAAYDELRDPWGRSRGLRRPGRAGPPRRPLGRLPRPRSPASRSATPRPTSPRSGDPRPRPPHLTGRSGCSRPDPPRPALAHAHPRRPRRRAVPVRPVADPRDRRRPRRHHRPGHLVRADRPLGPGTPAPPLTAGVGAGCRAA